MIVTIPSEHCTAICWTQQNRLKLNINPSIKAKLPTKSLGRDYSGAISGNHLSICWRTNLKGDRNERAYVTRKLQICFENTCLFWKRLSVRYIHTPNLSIGTLLVDPTQATDLKQVCSSMRCGIQRKESEELNGPNVWEIYFFPAQSPFSTTIPDRPGQKLGNSRQNPGI